VTALRDTRGAIIGYLLIGTDNSARKQVEKELHEARAVAEKANRAKTDFLSNMSHELRSPLNAILGFAQLLEAGDPPQTAAQKESTGQILQAGWYLLNLINEILDLAMVESGNLQLSLEPMSLGEVMVDCQSMIEPHAQKHGIAMSYPTLTLPVYVLADRTRVKQILINLLSNAIKYNQSGGKVVVGCVVISAEHVRISVKDSGPGLSPEKLAQLFQPFNRLGQEAHREEGTGIGLVMTKRLVELMGGLIGVKSTIGMGSEFWVDLIRAAEPQIADDVIVAAELERGAVANDDLLRTLLYIEDNPANMKLVEQIIARRPNMRLLLAGEAILGIELARIHQPEVILMDINLPGISGISALALLSEDPLTRHIPVVALSANAMSHDIEKGLEAGFFRYLTKPIKVTEFMETVDLALEFARTTASRQALKGAA